MVYILLVLIILLLFIALFFIIKEQKKLLQKIDMIKDNCYDYLKLIQEENEAIAEKQAEFNLKINALIENSFKDMLSSNEELLENIKKGNSVIASLNAESKKMNKLNDKMCTTLKDNAKNITAIEELFRLQMANMLINDTENAIKVFKESQDK